MITHKPNRNWLLAPMVLAPFSLFAADDFATRVRLEEPKTPSLNRFSVSYSAGFDMDAHYSGIGHGSRGGGPGGAGPATGGGIDRQYDDGYNKKSAFDPKSDFGLTWNWGYKNESQLDTANDRLLMHSTRARGGSVDQNEDPQHGFQLTFNREFYRTKDNFWAFGAELGFGWNDIRFNSSDPMRSGTETITDAYSLNGVRPPWSGGTPSEQYPQHAGDYDGPGTLIEDAPSNRTVTKDANGATAIGRREFDADFFFFHMGPYVEFPIIEKLRGLVSGGLSVGIMAGHMQINEQTTIAAVGTTTARGESDRVDTLIGGYVNASLIYPMNDEWSVFVGGQFQSMSDYSIKAAGRKLTIDMSATPFLNAGVSYSF